ncbi:hypothetical protein Salat_2930400 [Sesamum alatum]|uniref:Uncharacterized protein n=1 Tax=Sesamum alatum TaxID=300844 RepID=A0AAE2C8E4_9LAMI|nr:hypothetical protein Salat_2930400 [Sesamum alatum]
MILLTQGRLPLLALGCGLLICRLAGTEPSRALDKRLPPTSPPHPTLRPPAHLPHPSLAIIPGEPPSLAPSQPLYSLHLIPLHTTALILLQTSPPPLPTMIYLLITLLLL